MSHTLDFGDGTRSALCMGTTAMPSRECVGVLKQAGRRGCLPGFLRKACRELARWYSSKISLLSSLSFPSSFSPFLHPLSLAAFISSPEKKAQCGRTNTQELRRPHHCQQGMQDAASKVVRPSSVLLLPTSPAAFFFVDLSPTL